MVWVMKVPLSFQHWHGENYYSGFQEPELKPFQAIYMYIYIYIRKVFFLKDCRRYCTLIINITTQFSLPSITYRKTKQNLLSFCCFVTRAPIQKKRKTHVNRRNALLNILWPHLIKEHSITGIAQHAGPYPKIRFAQIKPRLTNQRQLFLAPRSWPKFIAQVGCKILLEKGTLGTSMLVINGIAMIRHCCLYRRLLQKMPGTTWWFSPCHHSFWKQYI